MKRLSLILFVFISSSSVQAELMGMIPGRGANLYTQPTYSIETGASWYTDQLTWSAIRFNIKPSHGTLVYFDYSTLRASRLPINEFQAANYEGGGFGGGLLFVIPDFFTAFDVAFKAAYHASVIDEVGLRTDRNQVNGLTNRGDIVNNSVLKPSQWSAELIFSPIDPVYENGLTWYSTLGYVSTTAYAQTRGVEVNSLSSVNYQQKDGLALGWGLLKPFGRRQFYAGVEWLSDDPLLGIGLRYEFK